MSNDNDKLSESAKPVFDPIADDELLEGISADARRAREQRVDDLRIQYAEGRLRFNWMRVAERMLDRIASGNKHR